MIRGVIFDLGNTLMYFDGDWDAITPPMQEALMRFLHAQGLNVDAQFAADFVEARRIGRERAALTDVEYTATQALRETLARYGLDGVSEKVLAGALAAFFQPEEECWRAYDDARATLAHLHAQGFRLALLSNATDHAFIERITRKGGLVEFLDPLLTSAALPFRKPDPRSFYPILEQWQMPPEEIVMVGDWPSFDILGARRAGLHAVLIADRWPEPTRPHRSFEDAYLMEPHAVIHTLSELPPLLERLNGKY